MFLASSLLALSPAALLLLFHAGRYYPFFSDDGFISLRYADRLVAGLGLTWTEGPRVEGYSNLTWVLATAFLHAFDVDLVHASRFWGALGMLGSLWCVVAWERRSGNVGLLCGAIAASAASLTGVLAVWVVGGLEQPLVVLFLCTALVAAQGLLAHETPARRRAVSLSLALLCLSRPDGPLLATVVLASLWVAQGATLAALRQGGRLAWPPAAAVLLQLVFRLFYYGDWVPNTARAKIALTPERLLAGRDYLAHGLEFLWPFAAVAIITTLLGWRSWKRSSLLVWAPLVAWTAYVVFIGGDIFPGRRHLVPIVVLLALALSSGLTALYRRSRHGPLLCVACIPLLAYQIPTTLRDPENDRALSERWVWDGQVLGNLLKRAFSREQPLLAVDPAGSVPFFSRLPSVDMLGLNDRYLAHHPPTDLGKGILGHELGSGEYIYQRQPDLVLLCLPVGNAQGCFRSGIELVARADFQRDYQLLTFQGRVPYPVTSIMYVRRQGRLGVVVDANAIRVPGLWLAGQSGLITLDAAGRIGAELPAAADVQVALPVACVNCRVQADSDTGASFELITPTTLRVRTTSATHVRAVTLHRQPAP